MKQFNLWATGCAHVHTDLQHGRESLIDAIRHSEQGGELGGPPFDWDIMLHLGDIMGEQGTPQDEHAEEVFRQYNSGELHDRHQIYSLLGNHDASGPDEPTQWWFKKYIDPTGENPETSGVYNDRRPYPVEGTWERYTISIGNMLIIMMADRNDGGPPAGRWKLGGYPAGKVTRETFEWWKDIVEANSDKVIVSCHHHMLKNTTVASGEWEGIDGGYHGRFDHEVKPDRPEGRPVGASYIYFVGDEEDSPAFTDYMEQNPGCIDLWLGGHTHTHPDDTYGGKSHIECKWDITFANCCALSKYHGAKNVPLSRLLTFDDGSDAVRIRCYMHTDEYAPQGWYDKVEQNVPLHKPFEAEA